MGDQHVQMRTRQKVLALGVPRCQDLKVGQL